MSGHSKWNNIKRKKEKTDGQKAKIFTKVGREIAVAVRAGGADPNSNSKLRDLIAKAKSLNVPNDNIQRIIKKAEGAEDVYKRQVQNRYGRGNPRAGRRLPVHVSKRALSPIVKQRYRRCGWQPQ